MALWCLSGEDFTHVNEALKHNSNIKFLMEDGFRFSRDMWQKVRVLRAKVELLAAQTCGL